MVDERSFGLVLEEGVSTYEEVHEPTRPNGKRGKLVSWLVIASSWVFTLLKTVLAVLVVALVTAGMILLHKTTGWEGIWKVTLIGTCGLFAILSVLVIIGGALDVRKLLRRLRERESSGESDSAD